MLRYLPKQAVELIDGAGPESLVARDPVFGFFFNGFRRKRNRCTAAFHGAFDQASLFEHLQVLGDGRLRGNENAAPSSPALRARPPARTRTIERRVPSASA